MMRTRFSFLSSAVRFTCWAMLSLSMLACSVSDRHVFQDAEGVVPETFFSTVKKGKTDKRWIVDHLGQPQSYAEGPNQEEIYTYHFDHARHRQTSVLVFFRYSGSENEARYYHVVLCDNLVKKAWWDAFEEVQVAKVTKRSGCAETESKDASMENIDRIGNAEHVPEAVPSESPDTMQQQMDIMPSMSAMQSARASTNASAMIEAKTAAPTQMPMQKPTTPSQMPKQGMPVPVLDPVTTEDVGDK